MDKFDFQSAEGLQLNLLSKEFAFLRFTGSERVRGKYESLKGEMRKLISLLKTPGKSKDSGDKEKEREPPQAQGDVLISEDGGFKYLLHSYALHGDIIKIRKPRVRSPSVHDLFHPPRSLPNI